MIMSPPVYREARSFHLCETMPVFLQLVGLRFAIVVEALAQAPQTVS